MIIQQQDQTLDSMAGTLDNIAQQASLMGTEIEEHIEYVVGLTEYFDSSPHKLFLFM